MSVSGRFLSTVTKNVVGHLRQKPCGFSRNLTHIRSISTTLKNYSECEDHDCILERRYSDKHEWVQVSGKIATIGISHYAQEALGDVVYAQLPDVGSKIAQKDECGALESVKAASEVYSPVSGTIVEKNAAVEETPALVNQSCYEKGWLFKLELSNESELKALMTEDQYKEFLKTDQH